MCEVCRDVARMGVLALVEMGQQRALAWVRRLAGHDAMLPRGCIVSKREVTKP